MSRRARTIVGVACALMVLTFSALWFVGQETSTESALAGRSPNRMYPGTWPPAARGFLWLFAGVAAVGFDILIMRRVAETQRGRDAVTAFAVVTGAAFLLFAIASFLNTDWSVIY